MTLALLATLLIAGPKVVLEPAQPRLGDPVAVYLEGVEHGQAGGRLEVFGYRYSLQPLGEFVLRAMVAIPADVAPGEYPIVWVHPQKAADWPEAKIPVADRAFETSKLRVAKKFTKPKRSEKLKARLRREQAEIQAVWTATPTPALDLGQPIRPAKTRLTGVYGTVRIFNEARKSVHYGVDLDGSTGEPVLASAAGRVALSSMRWGSGGTLVLDHGGGLFTVYFHLSKRLVEPGERVKRGQRIGAIGKSGRVTGPHLHFGVAIRAEYAAGKRIGQARSMYVDPETFWSMKLGAAKTHLDPSSP